MQSAPRHLSAGELEAGLPDVVASPRDEGPLVAIVVRPAEDQRRTLITVSLTPKGGIDGDRWAAQGLGEDGQPEMRNQVSLMNARILRLIAGQEEAMCLAGDNLIVDMDLGEENLPTGSRLAIGDVVLEMSDLPHTGCSAFSSRYGQEARQFINSPQHKQLHLRGRYARIVTGGTIGVGDMVRKGANS